MSNSSNNGLLSGKKGIVMGVANERSIAWGVAKEAHKNGATLAFSYQGEILKRRVEPLVASIGGGKLFECDVASDESIKKMFMDAANHFEEEVSFVIHSIAFAEKESLRGRFCETSRSGFALAMDISCYSLVSCVKHVMPYMKNGGSIICMSYFGAEKVIPNYNVMGVAKAALEASVRYLAADVGELGIRVNSLSPGPIRTLAASGIGDFSKVLEYQEQNAPLRRNVSQEEVGKSAVFLISDMSSGITGENIYVDAGYNVVGMPRSLSSLENRCSK